MKKWIQSLDLDKKEHVIVGVIYSILIPIFALLFGGIGALIGFMTGTFLNVWKEVYNDFYKGRGKAEYYDFLATQTPILIIYLTYLIK
jgi:ABC-type dipeptide/oligopeptide/nickel transport system permease component